MFVIEGREARAGLRDQEELDSILEELELRGYKSALRAMLAGLCGVASVDPASISIMDVIGGSAYYQRRLRSRGALGDLLFKENHGFLIKPRGQTLRLWCFCNHAIQSAIEQFCQDIREAANARLDGRRLRGMDFTWKPLTLSRPGSRVKPIGEFQDTEELEVREPDYSQADVLAANLLVNSEARGFLMRLAQVTKARASDMVLAKESIATDLLESGLIRREYLVTCRKDSQSICTLPERDLLDASGDQFKCSKCGRPFKDELLQEIHALTDFGRSLLTGSRWMSVWITELLVESGMAKEQIKWNPESNGEELDIMAEFSGLRVFFELKDREFGLGDAYPFVYRVNRYAGFLGMVVSMERVATDAKEFFQKQQDEPTGTRINTLEGEKDIRKGIGELVDTLSRIAILRLALDLTEAGVNVQPLLRRWLEDHAHAVDDV